MSIMQIRQNMQSSAFRILLFFVLISQAATNVSADPALLSLGNNSQQPTKSLPDSVSTSSSSSNAGNSSGIISASGVPEGPLAAATLNDTHSYPFFNYHARLAIARSFRDQLYYLIGKDPAADEHKWTGVFRTIVGDPNTPNAPALLPVDRRLQAAVLNNFNVMDDGANRYSVLLENRMHLGPVPNPNRSQEEKYQLYLFYKLEMDQLGQIPQGEAGEARFQQFKTYINQLGLEKAITYFYMYDPEVIERNLRDRAQQFGIAYLGSPETGQPRLKELMSITYQANGRSTSLYGKTLSISYIERYVNDIEATIKAAKFNIYSCLLPIASFMPYVNLGTSTLSGAALMDQVDVIWMTQFTTAQQKLDRVTWFTNTLDAIITGNLAVINGFLQPAQTRTPQILQILAARGINIYAEQSFIRIAQVVTDIIMNGTEQDLVNVGYAISFAFHKYENNLNFQDWFTNPTDKREPSDPDHAYFMDIVNATMTGQMTTAKAAAAIYLKRENDVRALYVEVFGRQASETEVAYYSKKPSLPFETLRNGFMETAEAKLYAGEKAIYQKYFQRDPAFSEVAHWRSYFLNSNSTVQGVLAAIEVGIESGDEYRTKMIKSYYVSQVKRNPAASEVNYYLNELRSGRVTLGGILTALFNSAEAKIQWVYSQLGSKARLATPAEIAFWSNNMAPHMSNPAALQAYLSSMIYGLKKQYGVA